MNNELYILLADDSRFFRSIESKFLQKTPTNIMEASNADEVLTHLQGKKPHLIYMAFSLPPSGGVSCCRAIKKDPLLRSIPVVMICDQGAGEQLEIARLAGSDACLVKPLDRQSFLQVGRRFVDAIREHRHPIFFAVKFSVEGEEFTGKSLDISGGGMFIDTQADLHVGTKISLSFQLPDSAGTSISCRAEVLWLNRKPNPMKPHYPHGLGVRFIDLPTMTHRAILRVADKNKDS